MGGAVLVVVVAVVPLFTLLFKLIRAFVVSLLVVFATDWGGVVDVVVGFVAAAVAASAAFKLAAAVFGVFVLTTAVPDENEENVESNDDDFMVQWLLN